MQVAKLSYEAQTEPKDTCRNGTCSRYLDKQTKSETIWWMDEQCFQLVIYIIIYACTQCSFHVLHDVGIFLIHMGTWQRFAYIFFFIIAFLKNLFRMHFETYMTLSQIFGSFDYVRWENYTRPNSKRQQAKYPFCWESCLANELTGLKAAIKSIWTKLNQIRDGTASAGAFVITTTKAVAITKAVMKKRSR